MLARVLKSAQSQSSAPSSPAKSSKEQYSTSSSNLSSSQAGMASPSKIPRASAAKENAAPGTGNTDRSSYLSFLWQDKEKNNGAPVPPSKVPAYDDDVHMMTMKGSVNPAAAKAADKNHAYHYQKQQHLGVPPVPSAPRFNDEDVRMRTAKPDTQVERGLTLWERELVDSAEVRRKATVAQICTYCIVDSLTIRLP